MRLLIIAAVLLSAGPSLASPRHPTPTQWKDIRTFEKAWTLCGGYDGDYSSYSGKYAPAELKKFCDVADKLEKKLKAQGFCIMGHVAVGRAGKQFTQKEYERAGGPGTVPKDTRHCYLMNYPSHP